MHIQEHNGTAWDQQAEKGEKWSTPASKSEIDLARKKIINLYLTPNTPVPLSWLGESEGRNVLCLAGGGGQQAPLLSAFYGSVTCVDNSQGQLNIDERVAKECSLIINTVKSDVANLHIFKEHTFDLIVNPCSSLFFPDLSLVWGECSRILKPGGELISGHLNPIYFMIDVEQDEKYNKLEIIHPIPYSDLKHMKEESLRKKKENVEPICFGHSLSDIISGQINAGLNVTGFYEDGWSNEDTNLNKYTKLYLVTRAKRI